MWKYCKCLETNFKCIVCSSHKHTHLPPLQISVYSLYCVLITRVSALQVVLMERALSSINLSGSITSFLSNPYTVWKTSVYVYVIYQGTNSCKTPNITVILIEFHIYRLFSMLIYWVYFPISELIWYLSVIKSKRLNV